jgi:hypothetical protein
LKEIKYSLPVNTQILEKQNSLFADTEKVLVFWIEDQINHSTPLAKAYSMAKILVSSKQ